MEEHKNGMNSCPFENGMEEHKNGMNSCPFENGMEEHKHGMNSCPFSVVRLKTEWRNTKMV